MNNNKSESDDEYVSCSENEDVHDDSEDDSHDDSEDDSEDDSKNEDKNKIIEPDNNHYIDNEMFVVKSKLITDKTLRDDLYRIIYIYVLKNSDLKVQMKMAPKRFA
jgi:hypothetical protein